MTHYRSGYGFAAAALAAGLLFAGSAVHNKARYDELRAAETVYMLSGEDRREKNYEMEKAHVFYPVQGWLAGYCGVAALTFGGIAAMLSWEEKRERQRALQRQAR